MKILLILLIVLGSQVSFAKRVIEIDGTKIEIGEYRSFGEVGEADTNPRLIAHKISAEINADCFLTNIDLCVTPRYYEANESDILVELGNGELVRGYILVDEDGKVKLMTKF